MRIALNPADGATEPVSGPKSVGGVPRDVAACFSAFLIVALLTCGAGLKDALHAIYWQDWADQSKYVASARAFAHGVLTPDSHWYPLLYPLALAVWAWLPLFVAALIVNGTCYVLAYVGFREIASRFGLNDFKALLLFAATTLVGSTLARTWVEPWTTTLSAALIWLVLARSTRASEKDAPPNEWEDIGTGALLGLIPLCRPADLIVSAIVALLLILRMPRTLISARRIGALASGAMAVVAPLAVVHLAIYGPRPSDYMKLSAAFGLDFAHLGWKAQILLVEPRPFYPYGAGLLERFPWTALGAAGFLTALLRPERRALAIALGLPAIAYALVMLAYVDLLPSGLWAFRNFHYFKWLMPLLGLFGYEFAATWKNSRIASTMSLCVVVAAASLHVVAVPAARTEPARLLTFSAPDVDFARAYFEHLVIRDSVGLMRNTFEFHDVPDARGLIYAEALRRDFAGAEHWADSPARVEWPPMDPKPVEHPPLLGAQGWEPLARYKPSWRIGWPCWLPPYGCPTQLDRAR